MRLSRVALADVVVEEITDIRVFRVDVAHATKARVERNGREKV